MRNLAFKDMLSVRSGVDAYFFEAATVGRTTAEPTLVCRCRREREWMEQNEVSNTWLSTTSRHVD